jgi:excisionase family DNA binding protein
MAKVCGHRYHAAMRIGDEEVLTIKQAAERLGVAPGTLSIQARKGSLHATLVGKTYLVTASEVERYRSEHRGRHAGFETEGHPLHGKRGGGGRKKHATDLASESQTPRRKVGDME